jgi:hypothetical protein
VGYFLAVSAFHRRSPDDVQGALTAYAATNGVVVQRVTAGTPDQHHDVLLFPTSGEWTVVLWPEAFNVHDIPACEVLSRELDTKASAVHVYDSDYWAHSVFASGVRLDRFVSWPSYFADDEQEADRVAAEWQGSPAVLADAFGVDASVLAPYLRRVDVPNPPSSKAFPDDEFTVDNFWVFTDFWARAGIVYPDDVGAFDRLLRLSPDFGDQLPVMAADEL